MCRMIRGSWAGWCWNQPQGLKGTSQQACLYQAMLQQATTAPLSFMQVTKGLRLVHGAVLVAYDVGEDSAKLRGAR